MLLESDPSKNLDFIINNSLTLRSFIGEDFYKNLVYKVVDMN